MTSTFELFVAWRYLRSRGSRAGIWTMVVAGGILALGVVAFLLGQRYAGMHPFEMTDSQIRWRTIFQLSSGVCVLLTVLVGMFGLFLTLMSIFSTISAYGVWLGTAALVIVLSVMNGFESDLRHKILGSNAHVLVTKEEGTFTEYRDIEAKVDKLCADGVCVLGHTPYLSSEAVVAANSNYATAIVKGIDPRSVGSVTDLPRNVAAGSVEALWPEDADGKAKVGTAAGNEVEERRPHLDEPKAFDEPALGSDSDEGEPVDFSQGNATAVLPPPSRPPPRPLRPDARVLALDGLLVGKEMSRNLHLYEGQEVEIVSPIGRDTPTGQMPRIRPFRIAGVFFTGMYEYDAKSVYVSIPGLQQFLSLGDEVTGIEIKVTDSDRTQPVVDAIAQRLGAGYRVQDWKELNKSLFSALKLEQIAMFLVLTIIILVASFSIISNLIMVVVEKGREIATLKSLGASDTAIMRVFMAQGLFTGVLGTLFGLAWGLGACLFLKYQGLPLDTDVYYIDRLPVAMSTPAIVAIAFAGVFISMVATIYPAYVGAQMRPIDGLRQ